MTNVNDHMMFKFDNVHGCRYDLRVFNAECDRTDAPQVCMQGTQNNATDDNNRHFDKQIDRRENLVAILPDDEVLFLLINVWGSRRRRKCPHSRSPGSGAGLPFV